MDLQTASRTERFYVLASAVVSFFAVLGMFICVSDTTNPLIPIFAGVLTVGTTVVALLGSFGKVFKDPRRVALLVVAVACYTKISGFSGPSFVYFMVAAVAWFTSYLFSD